MTGPLTICPCILGRRSQPDVGVALAPIGWKHLPDVLRPLRQQLPIELITLADKREQIGAPLRVNLVVEDVCERCAEHALSPPVRTLEVCRFSIPR